jgi:hypothetical protein
MFAKFLKVLVIVAVITASAVWSGGVFAENWEAPTANPPGENRFRPINTSDLSQVKSGPLYLTNATAALIVDGASPLIFGYHPNSGNKYVGLKASSTITTSVIWTLPITDGQNGWVLRTDGSGNLSWINPSAIFNVDADWRYDPTEASFTSIYSERLTRIGSGGTRNYAAADGDLYVQNKLEVDGLIYEQSATGNAEIDIKSGANTHWGLYQDITGGDLRFWNTNDNVTFTTNGRIGIGITAPAQALDVAGGIKLSGLIFDGAGSSGSAGQLLSRNASNIQWIDPTWWTNSSPNYIYSTQNTRIGNTGTVDQATGAGDLYVQNKLEVDGNSYLKNISATGLDLGFPNGVIPFQGASGLAYDANNLIWNNTSKRLGLGTTSTADFTLQVAGNVGPNTDNTYNLGSAAKRWANIFTNSLTITGGLDLGFTAGSVIFQGASALSQNNSKFFWDNTNNRLGLGTNTPSQALTIDGNLAFLSTTATGTSGALLIGNKRFMSSLGSSIAFFNSDYTSEENTNTFLGSKSGILLSADEQFLTTDNTGIGFSALANSNSGWGAYNTAVGSYSLSANYSGQYNTAVGANSLWKNQTGDYSVAVGFGALGSAISSSKTIAMGYNAGYYNVSGSENIFIGHESGYSNTGTANVMLGSGAGTNSGSGSGNVFLGTKAGFSETGSNRLYIEPSNANGNKALVYGQFYSASTTTSPFLRFNGKVGISPRDTANFTPNKLLHIYAPTSGDNAEIDIQSVDGANKHWAIYNNRNNNFLTFWNDSINQSSNSEDKNMLTLALNGPFTDKPALGIGTGLSIPIGHVEIRSKGGADNNNLNLSSFYEAGLGQTSLGYSLGSNIITFTGGRYRVNSDNLYEFKPSAAIWSGFGVTDGVGSPSDFSNAKISIQTLNNSGALTDTIVAQNGLVAIGSGIDRTKNFRVYGSTMSAENWSDNDGTQKGGSGYICFDRMPVGGNPASKRVRFEDGLYICQCYSDTQDCGSNNCNCTNPPI